jgi:hypothetical protein
MIWLGKAAAQRVGIGMKLLKSSAIEKGEKKCQSDIA